VSGAVKSGGPLLVVGGYGEVGGQVCQLLRQRHPDLELLVAGRSLARAVEAAVDLGNAAGARIDVTDADPLAGFESMPDGPMPAGIVVAVNDHHDHLLRAAIERGIPVVDVARWTERVDDAVHLATVLQPRAPVLLASGWMAGAVAAAINAARAPGASFERIEIDVLFYGADRAGPDSTAGFIDMHRPFEVWEGDARITVGSMSDPRRQVFPSGLAARVRRFSAPDQETLVRSGLAGGVALRMAFDSAGLTATFAALVRLGLWGRLPRATRQKLLHNPGQGAPHEIVVTLDGRERLTLSDPQGQTHLTAAGAVIQAERLLGLAGRLLPAPGVSYPEQAADPHADLTALQDMGVVIGREPNP
jgi:saccharopine dehydrogenase-like NADP-dependent oxidoreductase